MKNEKKKSMAKKMPKEYDLVTNIMAHEDGSLDEKGTRKLFSELNKRGLINKLQGHYGRTHAEMKRQRYREHYGKEPNF